jgi:hypothetical protein
LFLHPHRREAGIPTPSRKLKSALKTPEDTKSPSYTPPPQLNSGALDTLQRQLSDKKMQQFLT